MANKRRKSGELRHKGRQTRRPQGPTASTPLPTGDVSATPRFRKRAVLLTTAIVAALALAWLGFARPTGRNITSVHLPRMAYYQRALREGRLPLWNEQVDFGVPMLAEGQDGVCYPLNLVLYAMLDTHSAYTASMLLHFVLAAWFAYLCGRGFRLSRAAASLCALVFSCQGIFCRPP